MDPAWLACQSDCHGGQADGGIVADLGQGFQRHVTTLQGPLVVLLEQQGADQAIDSRFIGEDADDVGTAFDLTVEALQRIGAGDLPPVLLRKAHVRQHIVLGVIHQPGDLREALPKLIGHRSPLIMSGLFRSCAKMVAIKAETIRR